MYVKKTFGLKGVISFSGHHIVWLTIWAAGYTAAYEYANLKWLSVPFTIILGWVYIMMELAGDYSENPFEGLGNDIPMLSLCRTIEIDLKEMLGEENIPPAIQPKNDILM
jgi:predicted membrane chloride channel (bestrophin family)